jgi:hypothetical protein
MECTVAELSVCPLELPGGTGKRPCYRRDREGSAVVALYRYARHEIKVVAILEGVRTLASRPWPVGFRCGWYCVQSEVQAKELMDAPATEIEPLGNLIEGEPDDRAQAEHLKLALALDVPSRA